MADERTPIGEIMKILEGFSQHEDAVVDEFNENRSQIQAEIDMLHNRLLNNPWGDKDKRMKQPEMELLARLRQIQADMTANRIRVMDAKTKIISATKHLLKEKEAEPDEYDLRGVLEKADD